MTKALLEADFERYRSVVGLPLKTSPRGGEPYTLETPAALKKDFDLYCDIAKLHRVTDLYRENIEASKTGKDEITASFKLHILCGARQLVQPFTSVHVLKSMPEGWRIRQIISALGHVNWTLGRAEIADGIFLPTGDQRTKN